MSCWESNPQELPAGSTCCRREARRLPLGAHGSKELTQTEQGLVPCASPGATRCPCGFPASTAPWPRDTVIAELI